MANTKTVLQLQYGVNLHANHLYDNYQPLQQTAPYPDPQATKVREALAAYVGMPVEMIMCGNGSDELIDIYIRMYKLRDEQFNIAIAPPMYFQYPVYAERVGAGLITLPHDRSQLTPGLVAQLGGKPEHTAIMLDNPSNPAGDMTRREQIIALLEAGYRVFADEAYYEFCHQTVLDLLSKYPEQLVVSRTLSKVGAMAGSRLGYIVAAPPVMSELLKHKMLFNVNSDAQHRALYVLEHMTEFENAIQSLQAAKTYAVSALERLKHYRLFSSLDLFVIFKHHHTPSAELHQKLRHDFNIETFLFDNFKGHSVIRATTAQKPALQRLIQAATALA